MSSGIRSTSFGPWKCRRVFRSGEENRRQKCVEWYEMTKCFSNDSYRLWYFCMVKKVFFKIIQFMFI